MVIRPSIYASPSPSRGLRAIAKAVLRSATRTVSDFPSPGPNECALSSGITTVSRPLRISLPSRLSISAMSFPLRIHPAGRSSGATLGCRFAV